MPRKIKKFLYKFKNKIGKCKKMENIKNIIGNKNTNRFTNRKWF